MGNNSKSSVVYQGKIPRRWTHFALGALGKDLIYGMIVDNTRSRFGICSVACNRNADQCVRICNCIYRFSSDRCEEMIHYGEKNLYNRTRQDTFMKSAVT